ncbi:hypothetical protein [Castellaniella sp.]|uniref:hypothetical protein n=1 Tax=Castellaniella sp. TaxID=1955812 RepID=UPI002AFF3C05|nr:hypothetical protein [Castellaniella sp.]
MSGIQNLGHAPIQNVGRNNLDAGPLGQVGNLRFKAEPGATPRTSGPGVGQRILNFLSKTAFYLTASPAQRAQQFVLDQARDNSRRIGNLLGHLTAQPDDTKAQGKIAEGLARLGDLSHGDLSNLSGGKESLKTYLQELGLMDLSALRSGSLSNPEARQAILDQVDPPRLRAQAENVLKQIDTALSQQIAQDAIQAPLSDITELLSRTPVDGVALDGHLHTLSTGLAMIGNQHLDIYLDNLPDAQLHTLSQVLNSGKLDTAKQALSQIRNLHSEPPKTLEEAPDMRHDTLDPDQIQTGRITQGRTMLDRLSESLDQEIQTRVDALAPTLTHKLDVALHTENRSEIAKALSSLQAQVQSLENTFGQIPSGTKDALGVIMAETMQALRDPDANPDGPLNRDSLKLLDDHSLGHIRHSQTTLQPFGLELVRDDASLEGLDRVTALSAKMIEGTNQLLQTLAQAPVDTPVLMRQLRDLSDIERQRTQQLTRLGHYGDTASPDDRKAMMMQATQAAIKQLTDSEDEEVIQNALQNLGLINTLEASFRDVASSMGNIVSLHDYAGSGVETLERVSTSQHLLDSIGSSMHERLATLTQNDNPVVPAITLPSTFKQSLIEQYEISYDPATFKSSMTMTDAMRAKLTPHLEEPVNVKDHATHTTRLPVHGTDTEFSVSHSFFKDGIERTSISLSVRGTGTDGGNVRSTWPSRIPDDLSRDSQMGEALDSLVRIAGPAAEPLTRIMNQQLGAGILKGLVDLGQDSPFKLEDGSVVMPVGSGRFHFDVEKTPDGSFRLGATMTIPIKDAVGIDANGLARPVPMDKDQSWAQIHINLTVSSDGKTTQVTEPPQFRHHFVLIPPQDD